MDQESETQVEVPKEKESKWERIRRERKATYTERYQGKYKGGARAPGILVWYRRAIFVAMMAFICACGYMASQVITNDDMTQYLPAGSSMRQGLEAMEREWGEEESNVSNKFMLMFEGLDSGSTMKGAIATFIELKDGRAGVDFNRWVQYDLTSNFNADGFTLFIVSTDYEKADDTAELMIQTVNHFEGQGHTIHSHHPNVTEARGNATTIIALILMIVVLLLMCESFFDPLIIFATIAMAVVMNMGTNILFFGGVAETASSVAMVLQLILSINYALLLLKRYRQEKQLLINETGEQDNERAMRRALRKSGKTIISASSTTFVGLLMLMFMSFTIGFDMGLVFAKGVLFSIIAVFTIMPSLILWSDKIMTKLDKKRIKENRKLKRAKKLEKKQTVEVQDGIVA